MLQHFLRYVRNENWFLLFKHSRRCTNASDLSANSDRGRLQFAIELEEMQTFSLRA